MWASKQPPLLLMVSNLAPDTQRSKFRNKSGEGGIIHTLHSVTKWLEIVIFGYMLSLRGGCYLAAELCAEHIFLYKPKL